MFIKNYFKFIKYYYVILGDQFYDNVPARYSVTRKGRLPVIILIYLMMIRSLVRLFVQTDKSSYRMDLIMVIAAIVIIPSLHFGFIWYFIAYIKFNNKDNSINDRCICDYGITYTCSIRINEIIKKYFYLRTTNGNMFRVKFYLQAKGERRRKATNFKGKTLKITPNKIYFDGELIFDGKLLDMVDLENFLSNESAKPF